MGGALIAQALAVVAEKTKDARGTVYFPAT
jgi:hypothetical protein